MIGNQQIQLHSGSNDLEYLLWIFNLKKSSKQWTEFIKFGGRSFFIYSNLKNVDVVTPLLFHVLKITRLGKKIQRNIQN